MREPLRDKGRLEHILEAINRLQIHAGNLSKDELEQDVLRYYGIVKNIANMRNFLVHEYFQVDSEVVWSVIHEEIVTLKEQVIRYLNDTNWGEWEKTDYK
jgi:uncharacterized protein with HEPN domain